MFEQAKKRELSADGTETQEKHLETAYSPIEQSVCPPGVSVATKLLDYSATPYIEIGLEKPLYTFDTPRSQRLPQPPFFIALLFILIFNLTFGDWLRPAVLSAASSEPVSLSQSGVVPASAGSIGSSPNLAPANTRAGVYPSNLNPALDKAGAASVAGTGALVNASWGDQYYQATRLAAEANLPLTPELLATLGHTSLQPGSLNVPLSFETNQGQSDPAVKFISRGHGYTFYLTDNGAYIDLQQPLASAENMAEKAVAPARGKDGRSSDRLGKLPPATVQGAVIGMQLVGATSQARPQGQQQQSGEVNYLSGKNSANWHRHIATYNRVEYKGVYPGIDLSYYGNAGKLEYTFVVDGGVDPSAIKLKFDGADRVELTAGGDLLLHNGNLELRQPAPVIYQDTDDQHKLVAGGYHQLSGGEIGFTITGQYDHSRPLVIDPILNYSTFLGGSDNDYGQTVAVDSSGNTYIGGYTLSSNFTTTTGAYQRTTEGYAAFVTKLNPAGNALVYSTLLNGNSSEGVYGLAVDSNGQVYATGFTTSPDFPVTANAYRSTIPVGLASIFVTRLSADGSSLLYSSFFGASTDVDGYGIAIDPSGNAYVTGSVVSGTLTTTPGAFQANYAGGYYDSYVFKVNPTLTGTNSLVYATLLGGSDQEIGWGIAADNNGNAYVTGYTYSTDFPTTANAYKRTSSGGWDVFVTELNATGSQLLYSTYLGGSGEDRANAITLDNNNNVYVTGYTYSSNFSTTSGVYQPAFGGGTNAGDSFVAKLSPTMTGTGSLLAATFLGKTGDDHGDGVALDSSGNVYVVGHTKSSTAGADDFPTTAGAYQTASGGGTDAFLAEFNPTLSTLAYSTYLGGSGEDNDETSDYRPGGIAVDSKNGVYLTGHTSSANFPVSPGAYSGYISGTDAFVTKFTLSSLLYSTQPGPNGTTAGITLPTQPVLIIKNPDGSTATGYNQNVSVVISAGTGTGGAVLNGTTNVNAVNGVATFSNLSIDRAGVGYVLKATSGGMTAYSNPFTVTAPVTTTNPAAIVAVAGTPQSTVISTAFPVALAARVTDSASHPVSGASVTFQAPVTTTAASGTFSGTNSYNLSATTDSSGIATATVFSANGVVGSYVVTATVSGVVTPASFALTNTAAITNSNPPAAPTLLLAWGGNQQATVNWAAPAVTGTTGPITAYRVYRAPGTTSVFSLVGTTSGSTLVYTDTSGPLATNTTYSYKVSAVNGAGEGAFSNILTATTLPALPPDPTTVAPPVDISVPTTVISSTSFLYSGPNPIQKGVAPGTIKTKSAAVLRGRVLNADGATPLAGATVSVAGHPEFGNTLSRADGWYDLAVNGGGQITLNYSLPGYLPVQRQLEASWRDYTALPDISLVPFDGQSTPITVGAAGPNYQVALGTTISDTRGARQAALLFAPGTTMTMTLPDGSSQVLTGTAHVRITEYTVGANGPQRMPGDLPSTTAYTYAADYSIDEAIQAGASGVTFNKPVINYTPNFLSFTVGSLVPSGYYDYQRNAWIPSDNGLVIQILNTDNGIASIAITNNNTAATPDQLTALGITQDEERQLAQLYTPGQTLWRVPLKHFSPRDHNWPPGPYTNFIYMINNNVYKSLLDFLLKLLGLPDDTDGSNPGDECGKCKGSELDLHEGTLGESVDIAGTPLTLHYQSNYVPGVGVVLDIPVSGDEIPTSTKRIEVKTVVAGQTFNATLAPQTNLKYHFVWDGKDVYGRQLQGEQNLNIQITYVVDVSYAVSLVPDPTGFSYSLFGALPLGVGATNDSPSSFEYRTSINKTYKVNLWDSRPEGLGGWTPTIHHTYDTSAQILYQGDGRRLNTHQSASTVISVVNNTNASSFGGDGGPVSQASFWNIEGMTVGPDGSVYLADTYNERIRKVDTNGIVTTVAGGGSTLGDGGPATQAQLSSPADVALGRDGSLYIVEQSGNRLRRVDPSGIITTIAGTGVQGDGYTDGDGGPANQAQLATPIRVALGPEGNIYIVENASSSQYPYNATSSRVRKITPDGTISTLIGNYGCQKSNGDVTGSYTDIGLCYPNGIAVGADGSVYIADSGNQRIRRVTSDGKVTTVGGNGFRQGGTPTSPATDIGMFPTYLKADKNGAVYVIANLYYTGPNLFYTIAEIDPKGDFIPLAGTNFSGSNNSSSGTAATQYNFTTNPTSFALTPDGNIYFAERSNLKLISSAYPGVNDAGTAVIPSEDGSEIYQFDSTGRHVRTTDATTNATIYSFGYDTAGRLAVITDTFNNVTTITYDQYGNSTIKGPFGQQTTLTLNSNGFLDHVTDPASQTVRFGYGQGGLLTSLTEPNNQGSHVFTYTDKGRIYQDQDPVGGYIQFDRTNQVLADGTQIVTVTQSAKAGPTGSMVITQFPDNSVLYVNTDSAGVVNSKLSRPDHTTIITAADGTVTSYVESPDPRWGMQAPLITSRIITNPSGLVSTMYMTETVTLSDPKNPFSVQQIKTQVTTNGQTATKIVDTVNRVITGTSPAGRQSVVHFDQYGRTVSSQAPGLAPAYFSYDNRGRPISVTQGTGPTARTTTSTYDPVSGYLITSTDPLSNTTSFQRDVIGRVLTETLPGGRQISYKYDANSNLKSLTPPGQPAHLFDYNALNQPLTSTLPSVPGGGSNQYNFGYDANKQPTSFKMPDGSQVTIAYDKTGRPVSITLPSGTYQKAYDPTSGNLLSLTAPDNINLGYGYDGSELVTTTITGTITGNLNFGYDNFYRPVTETINGVALTYQYETDGALRQAGALTINRDSVTNWQNGTSLGSLTTTSSHDRFGALSSYQVAYNSSQVFSTTFNPDKLGRLTSRVEAAGVGATPVTTSYGYDSAERLSDVYLNGTRTSHYDYDSNGNRLDYVDFTHGQPVTLSASYDAQDRLLSYGGWTYQYTPNGEMSSKTSTLSGSPSTTGYSYDLNHQLKTVNLPGGTTIQYLTDGLGRRVGKKVNGTLVQGFLYEGTLYPAVELDGSNNVVSRFIYGADGNAPSYMLKNGHTYRLISDRQGSVRLVVDTADGTIAQRLDYDEWGQVLTDTNPGFQPFGYAGGLYDHDTGLVHFGAREYDPYIGRWTAKDPRGFSGGDTNFYAYVANDPINTIDPTGLDGFDLGGTARSVLQGVADFGTGLLDAVTFGMFSAGVLHALGLEDRVNKCSIWYTGGMVVGTVVSFFIGEGELEGAGSLLRFGEEAEEAEGAAAFAREEESLGEELGAACANSFSPDTLVATDHGEVPIGQIKVGDHVLAYNESTGATGYYTVTDVLIHLDPAIENLTIDGEKVQTTPEHPFYTQEKGWVLADQLWTGAHIRKADGSFGEVKGFEVVQRQQVMYNLTVDHAHTFFVGQQRWLTHNICGYAPNRSLPRDANGRPVPDSEYPHTQLGVRTGRKDTYRQSREWGENGQPVKFTDWTDHGRPVQHTNPHDHFYIPNPTGGSPQIGPAVPMVLPEF